MAFRSWPHDYEPDGVTPAQTFEEDFRFSLAAATQDGVDPTQLGGFAATFAEYSAVAAELARGAGSTALVFNMHASVTGALANERGVPVDLGGHGLCRWRHPRSPQPSRACNVLVQTSFTKAKRLV